MPLVDVSNLEVRYGPVAVVRDVSLQVEAGEVVAVLGRNGAGKTTTLETVEGFHRPSRGHVRVFGADPGTDRRALTPRWGVMPQQGGLPSGLRVGEVVELYAALHPVATDTGALLDVVGLSSLARRPWRRLSGGEQQRLSLAAALVGRPELLLLDEPTAALDPQGRREVTALLRARADHGTAVLMTTHLLDDVEEHCDRVVVLEAGRVAASGTVAELTSTSSIVTFRAAAGLPVPALAELVGAPVDEPVAGRYRVHRAATPALLASVTSWLVAHGATASHLGPGERLEDVFLRLTSAEAASSPPPSDCTRERR